MGKDINLNQLRQLLFSKLDLDGNGKINGDTEKKLASIFGLNEGDTKVKKKDFNAEKAQQFIEAIDNGEDFVFGAKITEEDRVAIKNCFNCFVTETDDSIEYAGNNGKLIVQDGDNNTGIIGDNNTVMRDEVPEESAPKTIIDNCYDCDTLHVDSHITLSGDDQEIIIQKGSGNVGIIGDDNEVTVQNAEIHAGETIDNCVDCEVETSTMDVKVAGDDNQIIVQNGNGNVAVIGDDNIVTDKENEIVNYALLHGEFPEEAQQVLKDQGLDPGMLKDSNLDLITKMVDADGVVHLTISSSSNPAYKIITRSDKPNTRGTSVKFEDGVLHVSNLAGSLVVDDDGNDSHEVVLQNSPDLNIKNKSNTPLVQRFEPGRNGLDAGARKALDNLGIPSKEVVDGKFDLLTLVSPPANQKGAPTGVDLSSTKHGFNIQTDSGHSNGVLKLEYNSSQNKLYIASFNGDLNIHDDGADEHQVEFYNCGGVISNLSGKPNHLSQKAIKDGDEKTVDDSEITYYTETHEDTYERETVKDIQINVLKIDSYYHEGTGYRGRSMAETDHGVATRNPKSSGTRPVLRLSSHYEKKTIGQRVIKHDALDLHPGAYEYHQKYKDSNGVIHSAQNDFIKSASRAYSTGDLSKTNETFELQNITEKYAAAIGDYPATDGKMSQQALDVMRDVFQMDGTQYAKAGFDNFQVYDSDKGPVLRFESSSKGIVFEVDSVQIPAMRNRMSVKQDKAGDLSFDNVIGRVTYTDDSKPQSHVTISHSDIELTNKTGHKFIVDWDSDGELTLDTTTNNDIVRYKDSNGKTKERTFAAGKHEFAAGSFKESSDKSITSDSIARQVTAADRIIADRKAQVKRTVPMLSPTVNGNGNTIIIQNGNDNVAVVGNYNNIKKGSKTKMSEEAASLVSMDYQLNPKTFEDAGFTNVMEVDKDGERILVFANDNGEKLVMSSKDAKMLSDQIQITRDKDGLHIKNFIGDIVTNGTQVFAQYVSGTVEDISDNPPKKVKTKNVEIEYINKKGSKHIAS